MWKSVSLKKMCVFGPQYGANTKAVPFSGNKARYVRITDIDANGNLLDGKVETELEDTHEYLLQDGDLLFARSGNTVGKTYRYKKEDGECVFAGYLIRFRLNPDLMDSRFAFYFTQSSSYTSWVAGKKRVAGQPNINGKEYSALKIPLPPLSEQRRIVEILDQADRLRKLRAEADKKAERILPALFIKMFGDPATNPIGWETAPFEKLVYIGTQLVDPSREEFQDLPHIGGEHIESHTGRILPYETVAECKLRSNKFHFSSRHILFSKIRPYLNKVAFPQFEGLCSADIYPLIPKDERTTQWFLVSLLRSQSFLDYAKSHSDRLRIPKLNKLQLGAFDTPIPRGDLLEKFEKQAERIIGLEGTWHLRGKEIEKIFSVMLHQAFTGEITASWRQANMKELLQEMELQAKALNN